MAYFAQSVEGGPVKIGYSDDVPLRIRQLERHYGVPMAVLATLPGGYEEEQAVHSRFAHLRFARTEQFRPAPDLMAFIGRPLLVGANPDSVEVIPIAGRANVLVVQGTEEWREWLKRFATFRRLTVVAMVDQAIVESALKHGFDEPPPPR